MDSSKPGKSESGKDAGNPGKGVKRASRESKVSGGIAPGEEIRVASSQETAPASPKTSESERRREAILAKVKERRETSVDVEEGEPEKGGDGSQLLPESLVKYTRKSRSESDEETRTEAAVAGNVGAATFQDIPMVEIRSTSQLPKMTFPQVVDQVRAQLMMGNVRQSSAIGYQFLPSLEGGSSAKEGEVEMETQGIQVNKGQQQDHEGDEDEAVQLEQPTEDHAAVGRNGTAHQRRHSTGSVREVIRVNLMETIRRIQQHQIRPPTESMGVKYLQYFMAFLYYICMSPVEPESAKKYPNWTRWIQYVVFWIFTISSLVQSLGDAKFYWIQFQDKETMVNFVTLGFYFANCFIRVYHVKLFATSSTLISNLLQKIDKVNIEGIPKKGGWAKSIAICFATFAMLLSGLSTLLGEIPLSEWTIKRAIASRAFELGEYLLLWTADNFKETEDYIYEKFSENIMFAGINSWLNYFGILHSCIMLDLWPIIAAQIFILQTHFTNALEISKKGDCGGRCPLSIHWRHYIDLREVCDDTQEVLKKDDISVSLLINFVTVIKVSLTYYMVQLSADKNEKYEECIVKCSEWHTTIEIDGADRNVAVLLSDMKKHPIGVGRGEFFVDEAFILKFVATVGSIFLLLSGEGQ